MARTEISATEVTDAGVDPAGVTGTVDGHMLRLTGREFIEVRNASGTPQNVTIATPQAPEGLAVADRVVSIPATNGRKIIGLTNRALYGQDSKSADAGKAYINYAAGQEAQFTTRAFRLPG
jgi:hypothetical protein